MTTPSRLLLVGLLLARALTVTAADPVTVGIVPFDTAAAEGSESPDAGRALATLVRIEMLQKQQVRPQLLDPPANAKSPIMPKQAAALGQTAEVDYVLVGTVLEATTKQTSNSAGSRLLGQLAGTVQRTSAKVRLHVELVRSASGELSVFEVEGSNTDAGVGATIYTTLGSIGVGDNGWQKTPMGKALREAAQKITKEVAARAKR